MSFKKISIERTGCYGACPIYQAEIYEDGRVFWHGDMYVSVMGEKEHKITKRKLERLNEVIEAFDYRHFELPEAHMFATDQPSCHTAIEFSDGTLKKIDHYLGQFDGPSMKKVMHSFSELEKFEKKIEQLAGLKKYMQW